MARVIVTVQLMPTSPDVDLKELARHADEHILQYAGEKSAKQDFKPIAFGLKAVELIFTMDEAKGGTEPLEVALATVPNVESVNVTDVRRAIG